jgi:hypothetical protein
LINDWSTACGRHINRGFCILELRIVEGLTINIVNGQNNRTAIINKMNTHQSCSRIGKIPIAYAVITIGENNAKVEYRLFLKGNKQYQIISAQLESEYDQKTADKFTSRLKF